MKLETAKRLHDALQASDRAIMFCRGLTRDEFLGNIEKQYAVEKAIEVIGEALRQAETTEPNAVAGISDVRKIVDMRNRLIHGYQSVDNNVVWETVNRDLPSLRIQLEELLAGSPLSDFGAMP